MNYPTHLPTVAGRVPDPYWRARQGLELLADAQKRYGAWLDAQPVLESLPTGLPWSEGAAFRWAFLAVAIVVSGVTTALEVIRLFV